MDFLQHAILFQNEQKERDELKPLSQPPSEVYIDGVPLSYKINTLQNSLSIKLEELKKQLELLRNSERMDRAEQIYITKQHIDLLCSLRVFDIHTLQDYEYVSWCYNGGSFRTPQQIEQYKMELAEFDEMNRIESVRASSAYRKGYHPYLFWLAWFVGLPIALGIWWEGRYGVLMGFAILGYAFIPVAIIASIATWIYCSIHAAKHNIPMSDFAKEAIIAGTSAGCIKHHYDKRQVAKDLNSRSQNV